MNTTKSTFFCTFGANSPFRNHYVALLADNEMLARRAIISLFGENWCSVYRCISSNGVNEYKRQADTYGLECLFAVSVTDFDNEFDGQQRPGVELTDISTIISRMMQEAEGSKVLPLRRA